VPTYVYECQTCEKTFEVEQRITEDRLTTCHCGKAQPVKRLIQPTAIMFKGSGFYVNDSVAKPSQAAEGAPAEAPAPSVPEAPATPEAPAAAQAPVTKPD